MPLIMCYFFFFLFVYFTKKKNKKMSFYNVPVVFLKVNFIKIYFWKKNHENRMSFLRTTLRTNTHTHIYRGGKTHII